MTGVGKWIGRGLLGLAVLLLLAAAGVYGVSEYRIQKKYTITPAISSFLGSSEPDQLARGRHVATIRGCVDCHGPNLGGKLFLDAPPVATVYSSNLTTGEGGIGRTYSDADWDRAIRHGVRPNGKPLLIMPSQEFQVLGDEDLEALVAYIRSVPPVDYVAGRTRTGPLGRLLFVSGQVNAVPAELIDHAAPRKPAPAPGPTAEYGAYLATGCVGCHGEGYSAAGFPACPRSFRPPQTSPSIVRPGSANGRRPISRRRCARACGRTEARCGPTCPGRSSRR